MGCVKPQLVIGISKAIEELYEKHNIRVIPRNGFLLGIIRHGGFLPNEEIDDDLGIVYTDLIGLIDRNNIINSIRIGNYSLSPKHTEKHWVNWKGVDPVMRKPYSFFGVGISRGEFSNLAHSIYPYHDTGTFFYPRCNLANFNHKAHMTDMLRYNPEGGNYRILETNELLNKTNSQVRGKQIGTVFNIANDCLAKKQFYFTTIYVPCDSEFILEAFYGRYWRNVENRGKKGGNPKIESTKLSDEENLQTLNGGPKPLCANEHPSGGGNNISRPQL